jgi:hypothetical protein
MKKILFDLFTHVILLMPLVFCLQSESNESGRHAWIKDMTLVEYVNSEFAESNRVIRSLVSKQSDALNVESQYS